MTTIFRHTGPVFSAERSRTDALKHGQSPLGSHEQHLKLALYTSLALLVVLLAGLAAWVK